MLFVVLWQGFSLTRPRETVDGVAIAGGSLMPGSTCLFDRSFVSGRMYPNGDHFFETDGKRHIRFSSQLRIRIVSQEERRNKYENIDTSNVGPLKIRPSNISPVRSIPACAFLFATVRPISVYATRLVSRVETTWRVVDPFRLPRGLAKNEESNAPLTPAITRTQKCVCTGQTGGGIPSAGCTPD